ncbi:MAG: hypothetical protein AAGU75_04720 [Bacillota bacterium]
MKCCRNDENKNELTNKQDNIQNNNDQGNHKSHISHMKMMALCCGLPILLILLLPLIGYKGILLSIVPFLCPIFMGAMMIPMMFMGRKQEKPRENTQQNIENK